jgi:hypothetical protein
MNFADDTLIFLKADLKMVESLKLLLVSFENLSGLKINYAKSTLVPLNISNDLGVVCVSILGCDLSELPLTYLGVHLHWRKLTTNDWLFLVSKIEKKLDGWKEKLLSLEGIRKQFRIDTSRERDWVWRRN